MAERKTLVEIDGDQFRINGELTYKGSEWDGHRIEGLLMNSRMVQGIFDDLNPQTIKNWDYPDGQWNADRNTQEFLEAMPVWRNKGLLGFTICLQGGSPFGYSKIDDQVWENTAFSPDGLLRPAYFDRLEKILDKADELGMVAIVGLFYFGQDQRMACENAIKRATENTVDWIVSKGYANIMLEIANEIDIPHYDHAILTPGRCHELVNLAKQWSEGKLDTPLGRLLVSISTCGNAIPPDNIIETVDFVLLHGNSVKQPERIREMVDIVRGNIAYHGQPILFNEDDHFDFDKPENNFVAAVSKYASWGYFDYRMEGEGYDDGYQSLPVNWDISSDRKQGFFDLVEKMTKSTG